MYIDNNEMLPLVIKYEGNKEKEPSINSCS